MVLGSGLVLRARIRQNQAQGASLWVVDLAAKGSRLRARIRKDQAQGASSWVVSVCEGLARRALGFW